MRRIAFCSIVFLALGSAAHADEPRRAGMDSCAVAVAEFESKSTMLQAKSELWAYGTTKAMSMHPDSMYSKSDRDPAGILIKK